jgi:hypothetical protein
MGAECVLWGAGKGTSIFDGFCMVFYWPYRQEVSYLAALRVMKGKLYMGAEYVL